MALDNENGNTNGFYMPVAPAYMGGGYGMNNGGFGGDGLWFLILFFLLIGNNGWGGFGGFGGGFNNDLYPWMNQSNQINGGFRDQMLNTSISSIGDKITSGFGDVQLGIAGINQNLCQTGNGIINAVNGGFNNAEVAANARQIANMQQAFAAQTAQMQGFNSLQAQAADCCCKTQTSLADTRYAIATESCATRTANSENTRDIIDAQTRGTQAILDKLCQLELDGVKGQLAQAQRENVGLQNQVNMAAFRESQANQNALFAQGMNNEVDALYNRLKNCPVGTVPVAGNTPLFSCNPGFNNGWNGCGCGNVA